MLEYIIYKLLHIFISNHKESKIVNLLFKNNKFLKNKNNLPIVIFDVGCFRGDWTLNMLKELRKKTSKQANTQAKYKPSGSQGVVFAIRYTTFHKPYGVQPWQYSCEN